jgi:predicted metal-dependent phosphoesterase TrpH
MAATLAAHPGLDQLGSGFAAARYYIPSHLEELVEQAARLDMDALALTDHDGMYGAVRLADAAAN